MKRINVFVPKDILNLLKDYPGTISEHTRRALSEYSAKLIRVSISPTKEEGDSNEKEKK